jgi:hypothetical protein
MHIPRWLMVVWGSARNAPNKTCKGITAHGGIVMAIMNVNAGSDRNVAKPNSDIKGSIGVAIQINIERDRPLVMPFAMVVLFEALAAYAGRLGAFRPIIRIIASLLMFHGDASDVIAKKNTDRP